MSPPMGNSVSQMRSFDYLLSTQDGRGILVLEDEPSDDTLQNCACAPLATVVEWDEDGKWLPPPTGVRLSDELAYIATKSDISSKTLKQTYSFDFDGNGMIQVTYTPEDPAPSFGPERLSLSDN
ncbi:uncharacterized protein N7487_010894 [Penicillium crustosum]|uniref:uncharacterized protein n=1 Tax=Penicillium crustosum TaxID=36656 RepID=UPI0023876638|nr:uncharacterized protein N7487_010894 [Penicillium crustosum]KAJ5393253.1 hypothetical protein N7487_010894 [Penicillium crustosum]